MSRVSNILTIANSTFRELVRSKALYSTLFFAIAVMAVAASFGVVTIGDQAKIIKDFGLFAMSFGSTLFVIISGSSLLFKELQRKTIYNLLSKPVSRGEFLAGKYFGMLATTALMAIMMALMLSLFSLLMQGSFDTLIGVGLLYVLFEVSIVCAAAIFFSALVVTPLLGGFFTLGVFLCGRSADYLLYFVNNGETASGMSSLMRTLYWTVPNLAQLNVSNMIVYGNSPPLQHVLFSFCYSVSYSSILLLLAAMIFKKRDFN